MKFQLFSKIATTGFFWVILFLAVRTFRKDPSDNIALFSILFFTALITLVITTAIINYRHATRVAG